MLILPLDRSRHTGQQRVCWSSSPWLSHFLIYGLPHADRQIFLTEPNYKSFSLMLMSASMLVAFALPASAQSNAVAKGDTIQPSASRAVVSTIELLSTSRSAELNSVKLLTNANGSVSVQVSGSNTAGVHSIYDIEVDKATKTYTAMKTTDSSTQSLMTTLTVTNYTAHVRAKTYDPVNILCNYTDLGKTWSDDHLGHLGYVSRSLNYFDANPTSAGTNWYFVSGGYYNTPNNIADESAQATHVNYNFAGGLFGTTYVDRNISIYPQSTGNGVYNWCYFHASWWW